MDEKLYDLIKSNSILFKGTPRSPERIPEMLTVLEEIWTKYPDLRLGQLIVNCVGDESKLYYMEDDILLEKMKEFLNS